MDFSIWANVEAKACVKRHMTISGLKRSVTRAWNAMEEAYIVKTCHAFRGRIEAVIAAEGCYIEN